MNYQQAVEYLNSFINYEREVNCDYSDMKLDRVKQLLAQLNNPQDKFKSIHIVGTKGKGSTCAFIFSILKEAGYTAGLYTSPHLIDFKERIKISYHDVMEETRERLIEQDEVTALVEEIKPYADAISGLTFFEIYTVLAFMFFAQQKIEFAVLETGLGGRLDATNVVKPLVCGFASISLEHTQILGNSIEKITREKAGIIKKDTLVVSVTQLPQAWAEIESACKDNNAKLYQIGKDFLYDVVGNNLDGSIFDFNGKDIDYYGLHISMAGQFQVVNAALAIGVIHLLRFYEIVISSIAIRRGLQATHWPGRMQIVHKNPFLVFDGAQNPASAQVLRAAVNMIFIPKKSILVFGVCKDKDVRGMIQYLGRQQNMIILTQSQNPRAMDVDELANLLPQFKRIIRKTHTVQEAMKLAFENSSSKDDLILVTGSLYVVGEAFTALKTIKCPRY
ncbi:MAG: bifunctional folylpolyglutamate synthase/dihydrofolate synthase [Candidatus Omnitrophica bacterium]|nr:bifunctional folylpolyglutamate synthase/dihydrofolate synthase [Candidatus Omnitrophota bacterium]